MFHNYRDYWKEAGYIDQMSAIETAMAENRRDNMPKYLPDHSGSPTTRFMDRPAKVRDQLATWYAASINTPVLVPNSLNGNPLGAFIRRNILRRFPADFVFQFLPPW